MGVIYYKLDAECKTIGDTLKNDTALRISNKSLNTTLKNYLKPQVRGNNIIQRN